MLSEYIFNGFFGFDSAGEESSTVDYLNKGDILLSLAREVYKRERAKLDLTEVEKCIYALPLKNNMSLYDLISHVARSFVRPCLKSMDSCTDEYARLLLDAASCRWISLSFSYEEDRVIRDVVLTSSKAKKLEEGDRIIKVVFSEEGYPPMEVYGHKNTTHKNHENAYTVRKEGYDVVRVADMGYFLASLTIYSQVMNTLYDERVNPLYEDILKGFRELFFEKVVYKKHFPEDISVDSIMDFTEYPVVFPERAYHNCRINDWIPSGLNIQLVASHGDTYGKSPHFYVAHPDDLASCYLLAGCERVPYHSITTPDSSNGMAWMLPIGYVIRGKGKKMYDTFCMEVFASLFFALATDRNERKREGEYFSDLDTETRAKSYQLKKNIPEKVLKEMEQSIFNQYFGFVEYDEACDLSKVTEIAREFQALKDTYFSCIDASGNAIRFRKLGNHKAYGLYYPSIKCLCVDIRHPSSLVHEFGHLIDYTLGKLSSQTGFTRLKTLYMEQLYSKMERDEAFRKRMESSTKYNLDYYSLPTEIFARSFELYVAKVLGVRNSIVPDTFSDVYPDNDGFLREVENYFSSLFKVDMQQDEERKISETLAVAG